MKSNCADVMFCLQEDLESLHETVGRLLASGLEPARKRAMFKRLIPLFQAYSYAEEQTVLEHGLQVDLLRPLVLEDLEQHELLEHQMQRVNLAVDHEQWQARLKVFCELLQQHLRKAESRAYPLMGKVLSPSLQEELGRRYRELRSRHQLSPLVQLPVAASALPEAV